MVETSLSDLAFHDRTRREVLHKSDLIPPLPEVVVKVLGLMKDKTADLGDFEDCLRNDAALVARLLRVVNSPFYGMSRTIGTIKDAVGVIGMRSLRGLVLAAGTASYLERDYACYGHDEKGLWKHSICVASGARALARCLRLDVGVQEELFVAGLLHDMGKMLLGPYLARLGVDVTRHADAADAVERRVLGIDHQEIGAVVAEKWNLSPMTAEVIRRHHGDEPSGGHRIAVALVRLADADAHALGHGYRPEAEHAPAAAADREAAGLDGELWEQARDTAREAMELGLQSLGGLSGG